MDALIAGNARGDVWAAGESSALLWDKSHRVYFAGQVPAPERIHEVGDVVRRCLSESAAGFVIAICAHDGWKPVLPSLFPGRALRERERRLYHLHEARISDWRDRLPDDVRILPIDGTLLGSTDLRHLEYVIGEIETMWDCVDDFLRAAFGYCAVVGDEVVSWCTAEYVSGSKCGIGIETIREFQGRGLATVVASAFVEHCVTRGIEPHWECWTQNAPSVRVAEKVGFAEPLSYFVHVG